MSCYYTLYHNTYAFSLLFYKVYMKRENAGSWNSGMEKEQILETYLAQLQKSWNFMENSFGKYKKILGEESTRGGPPAIHKGGGRALPPRCAPCLVGHLAGPRCPSSAIWCVLTWKNQKELSGRSTAISRRNLGRTNLGLRQSCFAGETSLRDGEIKAIVITNDPLIKRGSISINIFTSTISSQTLVHLLYPIFVSVP